jgi:hypothetical protein
MTGAADGPVWPGKRGSRPPWWGRGSSGLWTSGVFNDSHTSSREHDKVPRESLAAASVDVRLLVVGCPMALGPCSACCSGSVSRGALHLASCPVAVVHQHR